MQWCQPATTWKHAIIGWFWLFCEEKYSDLQVRSPVLCKNMLICEFKGETNPPGIPQTSILTRQKQSVCVEFVYFVLKWATNCPYESDVAWYDSNMKSYSRWCINISRKGNGTNSDNCYGCVNRVHNISELPRRKKYQVVVFYFL
jgi:hypothetical protein